MQRISPILRFVHPEFTLFELAEIIAAAVTPNLAPMLLQVSPWTTVYLDAQEGVVPGMQSTSPICRFVQPALMLLFALIIAAPEIPNFAPMALQVSPCTTVYDWAQVAAVAKGFIPATSCAPESILTVKRIIPRVFGRIYLVKPLSTNPI